MPKLPTYLLHWLEEDQVYELTTNGSVEQRFGREGGPSWFHFLETQTSFAFHGREGRLSLTRETRLRGAGYWYAYRTSGRRTNKRYLGGASKVTIVRLEEVAGELNRAVSGTQTPKERMKTGARTSSPTSLLLPKLLPPRLPFPLVERPRLLERLDAALECKLTLLVAPAGYGKTTIANQWMNDRRAHDRLRPLAWFSLDSGDNDLYRFWHYIIAACQMFQQDLGQTALASLFESLQPPFTSPRPETSLTLLLNDLTQQVQGGLLVLDDYHVIEEPAVHETLTFFLDHLPPTFCVLLLTRAEPRTLPLLRWRARGELAELHGVDLRFSPEETAAFVRGVIPVPLSDAALKRLDSSLQGWIAGLRLVTLTLSRQANSDAVDQALASLDRYADPSSPYRTLLDYFVTEILDAQPERLQRFLLQTSVLSRLSSPLCAAVTGEEQSAVQLEAIERGGLFLEALDGAGGWYRFHTLFSEAMYREAAHRLGEERLRALSLRASFWYERHAMAAEAVEAALLAHEFERAASLIEQMNMDQQALAVGRRHLDREIIAQALRNLANISFEWNELAVAEQQASEAQTLALESELDLRSSVAFQLALLTHARGQITSAQQQVAALLAHLQTATTPEAALKLPSILIFSARLALEVGDLSAAKRILETPGLQEQTEARIFQARLSLAQSKPREALLQLDLLLPDVQDRFQAIEIQVLLALAHAACQEGREARQWLQLALSQARAEGFVRVFLSEGEPLVRLLRQLVPTIQERVLRAYAQSILRAFAQPAEADVYGLASSAGLLVEPLSTQEQRVLRLLVAGETNRQIAQELVVSVNTVKDHVKHLYNKLGVSNRLQASEAAHRLKLI